MRVKTLMGASMLLACSMSYAGTLPTRFVFFGDSITDTGDFPEPSNTKIKTPTPTADNPPVHFNFYVPLTNPVTNSKYGHQVSDGPIHFFYPSRDFLEAASFSQGRINTHKREAWGIGWSEYAVWNLYAREPGGVFHINLYPWTTVWKRNLAGGDGQVPKEISLNYAWAGATLLSDFTNASQIPVSISSNEEKEVYTAQKMYRDDSSSHNLDSTAQKMYRDDSSRHNLDSVIVPGLAKQIDFYTKDIKNGKVAQTADEKTDFVVFIGANDIGYLLRRILLCPNEQNLPCPQNFASTNAIAKMLNYEGALKESLKKTIIGKLSKLSETRHIYLINLFDLNTLPSSHLGLPPSLAKSALHTLITMAEGRYNALLEGLAQASPKVTMIHMAKAINALAKTDRFKDSVKDASQCVKKDSSVLEPNPTPDHRLLCDIPGTNKSYFAWNDSHVTARVQQKMAQIFIKAVQNS